MARVLIPLAEGCEELEAVTVIDLLRRAGIRLQDSFDHVHGDLVAKIDVIVRSADDLVHQLNRKLIVARWNGCVCRKDTLVVHGGEVLARDVFPVVRRGLIAQQLQGQQGGVTLVHMVAPE